jgi:Uma2 family endonuclease
VIPDIVFFKRESTDRVVSGERLTSAPELVIEILSPGSENIRRDRVAKHRLYSKYEVPEYWLIDLNQKRVEIYRLRDKELRPSEILTGVDELTTPVLPGFSCLTNQIFILPPLSNQ